MKQPGQGRIRGADDFWKDVKSRLRNRKVPNFESAISAHHARFRRGGEADGEISEVEALAQP